MAAPRRRSSLLKHISTMLLLSQLVLLQVGCDFAFGPTLGSLQLVGTENAVYPEFRPLRNHYAVHPGATDALQLTATAAHAENLISINGSDWAEGSASLDLAAAVPGDDIHVTVSTPLGLKRTYVIHYLPENFPEMQVTVSGRVTRGLIFMTPRYVVDEENFYYLMMVDNAGVPHWYERREGRISDLKLQGNGQVTFSDPAGRNEYGVNDSEIVLLDEDLAEERRVTTVGLTQTDNHDSIITPDGNHLLISYNTVLRDMTAYGYSDMEPTGDSVVQEVTPEGDVVWEWSTWGNVPLDDFTVFARFPGDYAHVNSIYLTEDDGVIMSFRGGSQIYKIARYTGEVLWRFGGSWSDFEIVGDPFEDFCGQHTAWEDREGNLVLFDNGAVCGTDDVRDDFTQFSRAVSYDLDLETGTATFLWDHALDGTYDQLAFATGSAQSHYNGHTVIGWGTYAPVAVTEIDENQQEVFRLSMVVGDGFAQSYRALRYPFYRVPVHPVLPELPRPSIRDILGKIFGGHSDGEEAGWGGWW